MTAAWKLWEQASEEAHKATCRSCRRKTRHPGCERVEKLSRSFARRSREAREEVLAALADAERRAQEEPHDIFWLDQVRKWKREASA